MKNPDAFPSPGVVIEDKYGAQHHQGGYGGMSLRDYFAAKALNGLLAGMLSDGSHLENGAFKVMALIAYKQADAMLAAREAK